MPQIQSYNTVVNALTQFSNAHLSLRRFKTSFFSEFNNFAGSENSFPILYAVPNQTTFGYEVDTLSFRLYCVDQLQKDRTNEQTIMQETLLVLRDFVNWTRQDDSVPLNVINNPRAVPVNNFLTEFTAGWYIDIDLEPDATNTNDCSIPFSANFQFSGITCTDTFIPQYLTCDSMSDCQEIINIWNDIYALQISSGHSWTTGFTYDGLNSITLSQNGGKPNFTIVINDLVLTALTVNGTINATTFSGGTYYGNGQYLSGITTTDYYVTGGTYNNGSLTLDRQNGSVTIPGFYTGTTDNDNYVTGFTYTPNQLTILSTNGNVSTTINNFSGLTVNGSFSATTYLGLPASTDYYVTGGTYNNGTLTLDRQNGSVSIPGFLTGSTGGASFTGGSANCITDFYVSNVYGCGGSDITTHNNIVRNGSTTSQAFSTNLGKTSSSQGSYTFIGVGITNTLGFNCNMSSIIGGHGHTISNVALYSAIVGGVGNTIDTGYSIVIAGGQGHTINGHSNYASINGGIANVISSSVAGSIGGGISNHVYSTSTNGHIGGGTTNLITSSINSVIGGGNNNTITSSARGVIAGGQNNTITSVANTQVLGSNIAATVADTTYVENLIIYTAPLTGVTGDHMLVREPSTGKVKVMAIPTAGGTSTSPFTASTSGLSIRSNVSTNNYPHSDGDIEDNFVLYNAWLGTVQSPATVTGSFVMGGGPASYNAYVGPWSGDSSFPYPIQGSFAFGPANPYAGTNFNGGVPGGSPSSKGVNAPASFAISNQYWIRSGATWSGIFAGIDNMININSTGCFIGGGSGNTINRDVVNSVIIGGRGMVGTASDTVYVPGLNIRDVNTTTAVQNLGIDANGYITSGSTGGGSTITTDEVDYLMVSSFRFLTGN